MSNKATYQGTPPKYLNDFSKALAGEVRILLAEVGKLRDERRQLQYEIAELMAVKSKHGSGGEYAQPGQLMPSAPEAPPPAIEAAPVEPAKPGWRVVHKRQEMKARAQTKVRPAPPPAAPEPPPPANVPAWAQWRPNPLLAPVPSHPTGGSMSNQPPPRAGLFGPATPPPK